MISVASFRAILLDVEGTTTPIRFVHDVLFPYSHDLFPGFLRAHALDPEVRGAVDVLRSEHAADASAGSEPPPWEGGEAPGADYARWLIAKDRKSTPLKSLQGRIWEEGYLSGALRGQVYPDVRPAFERWTQAGKVLAIFSSGSVLAQRLLFGHSEAGDLAKLLSAHFDTTTGSKTERSSYEKIAAALGLPVSGVLFLSDVAAELDAARSAGMATTLVARDQPVPDSGHPVVRDLSP